MTTTTESTVAVSGIRPLVRYADTDVAVIDLQLAFDEYYENRAERRMYEPSLQLLLHMQGPGGRVIDMRSPLDVDNRRARARFEIDHPHLWWPAGMGDQSLYCVNVKTLADNHMIDNRDITLGMASVRQDVKLDENQEFLVNGQPCSIRSIVPVTPADETELLPAGGNHLLLVHDHFGPDVLYDAADRAGLLMLQAIPVPPDEVVRCGAKGVFHVDEQVNRLTGHPSLAGWFIAQVGQVADQVAKRIHALDPTRMVFRHIPLN